jgi:hypothetical protein
VRQLGPTSQTLWRLRNCSAFCEDATRSARSAKVEGEADGEARAVLALLEARRIEVPDATRALITGCQDLAQLDTWVRRAATAASIDDLFA